MDTSSNTGLQKGSRYSGVITRVYYFSPHSGLLSKLVMEIKLENGESARVEKTDTQEALAKQFGFRIKEPHVWDTRSLENRECTVALDENGEAYVSGFPK